MTLAISSAEAATGRYKGDGCSREAQQDEATHRRQDPGRAGVVEARIASRSRAGVLGPNNPMPRQGNRTADRDSKHDAGDYESPKWLHQNRCRYR
jgi:hypothetical protein